jgi:type I restriction enzyme R subunit
VVIDIYDILQSKEDKATVPIYYEARLAKIDLKPEERPKIDPNFEEVAEDAEESTKESLRRKWAQLEAMVGTDKRIALGHPANFSTNPRFFPGLNPSRL